MLDRRLLKAAFERALRERTGNGNESPTARSIALRAREIYRSETNAKEPPSLSAFERFLYDPSAAPAIRGLLTDLLTRHARVDEKLLLASFQEAVTELREDLASGRARRLQVARRAHALYVGARASGPPPSVHTFERLAYGSAAPRAIRALLQSAMRRPVAHKRPRARLDRNRLGESFREAIRRLEARLSSGRASPLQVARRAYALYTEVDGAAPRPSPHTFQRLLYGKSADPEIAAILRTAFVKKDRAT